MDSNKQSTPQKPRRRSIWPFIIVGLLGAHVVGMMVAVAITRHDRTFLVVPDYYDKAQHWDAAQAEKRSSASLGWTLQLGPAPAVDDHGNRSVLITLADANGQAIPGLTLTLDYFHHAHPDEQHKILLTASAADGRNFSSLLPMSYEGVWEFHFTGHAGDKTFVETQTTYLASHYAAPELHAAAK